MDIPRSNEVSEIEVSLQGIISLMIQQQEEREGLEKEQETILEELNAIQKRQLALARRRAEIDEKLRSMRRQRWTHEEEKKQKERELQVAKRTQELVIEFHKRSAELDKISENYAWRVGTEKEGHKAKEYQIVGAKRLAVAKKGICADKRGLGKTVTGLVWLDLVQSTKGLLIAPNDVVKQFEEEMRKWIPHKRIFSLSGMNPMARSMMYKIMRSQDDYIATLNYEAWRRDKTIIDQLVDLGLDSIICDEAHRAKTSNKLTARGIFQVIHAKNYCPTCKTVGAIHNGVWVTKDKGLQDVDPSEDRQCKTCNTYLEPSVKNVLPMTGTPILNKPQEMFSLLYMVDPIAFPSEKDFLRDYCVNYGGRWKFLPGGESRMVNKIKEFFVQRNRDDVGVEIPPPAIIHHELDFDARLYPKQFEAYEKLNNAAAIILEQGEGKTFVQNSILNIITRSRQMQTWPAGIQLRAPEDFVDDDGREWSKGEIMCNFDVHESQKLDAVLELCRELAEEGERFIVWSQFKPPLYEACRRLQQEGFAVTTATGDDDKETHREEVRKDFDLKTAPENPKWIGCFATYKAFGTGINLHAARHAISLDDEWNPGMQDQAFGRIDRMDNQDQATVHIFRVKKTIDTFMSNLIEQKRAMTEDFEGVVVTATEMLNALRDGEI